VQLLKRIASKLPLAWQSELKRLHYKRQLSAGTFISKEPEFDIIERLVAQGDWVLDIGANVGHYTKKLSDLVGINGRVIAFEPVPATFALLSSNVQSFAFPNVTLVNAAVSDTINTVGMSIPLFPTGLTNYYEAHLSSANNHALSVLTLSLDSFLMDRQISFIKIDAEGHELQVLHGMKGILEKHKPTLLVETKSDKVLKSLSDMGYSHERYIDSPNVIFKHSATRS